MSTSSTYSSSELKEALEGKGFRAEASDHWKLYFWVGGVKTAVFVPVSHSRKTEYSFGNRGLLNRVKKEAGLRTNKELRRLLDCDMSYEEYCSTLAGYGVINLD